MLLLRFAFYQNNILAETQHEFAYFHRGSKKTFRKIVEHQVICLYLWIIGSQTVQFVLANSLLFILNKTVSKIFYMGSRVFTAPTETTCWFNFWAFKTNDEDVFERGCVASEEGEVDLHQNSQVVARLVAGEGIGSCIEILQVVPYPFNALLMVSYPPRVCCAVNSASCSCMQQFSRINLKLQLLHLLTALCVKNCIKRGVLFYA